MTQFPLLLNEQTKGHIVARNSDRPAGVYRYKVCEG